MTLKKTKAGNLNKKVDYCGIWNPKLKWEALESCFCNGKVLLRFWACLVLTKNQNPNGIDTVKADGRWESNGGGLN